MPIPSHLSGATEYPPKELMKLETEIPLALATMVSMLPWEAGTKRPNKERLL